MRNPLLMIGLTCVVLTGCGQEAPATTDGAGKVNENSFLTETASGNPPAAVTAPQAGGGHSAQDSAGSGEGNSAVGTPGK